MQLARPPPDPEAFIAQTRSAVASARDRLTQMQTAMDGTVGSLQRRCAQQVTQLEAEASRRGRLEVELAAAEERAEALTRRAEAAEARLQSQASDISAAVRLQPPSASMQELASVREEALAQARRADEAAYFVESGSDDDAEEAPAAYVVDEGSDTE